MAWFKVISHTPITVNHGNGAVQSLPRGQVFEADENLPDIRRYQRLVPPKVAISAPSPTGIKAPGANYPIPGPKKAEAKAPTPPGISEVVKSPALRSQSD